MVGRVKVLLGHRPGSLVVAFGRMYLLSSNASSFLLRTKTGARTRCVREHPSNPHGQATSETAATGTCVQIVARAFHRREKASVATVALVTQTYPRSIVLARTQRQPPGIRSGSCYAHSKFKTCRFALGPKNVHQPWPLALINGKLVIGQPKLVSHRTLVRHQACNWVATL